MEPQLEGCGKSNERQALHVRPQASMEPQLEGCGKFRGMCGRDHASVLQWSRNLRVAESSCQRRFSAALHALQWSRNLRVAESAAVNRNRRFDCASMEPQLEGCGKDGKRRPRARPRQGFNGAAT